jgi:hypothetical protein
MPKRRLTHCGAVAPELVASRPYSPSEGRGACAPLPSPCLIPPSAWKNNSPKFTDTSGAPIVGFIAADISNTPPPSLFRPHIATIVARNRYERLRLATKKRAENFRNGAPQGAEYLR